MPPHAFCHAPIAGSRRSQPQGETTRPAAGLAKDPSLPPSLPSRLSKGSLPPSFAGRSSSNPPAAGKGSLSPSRGRQRKDRIPPSLLRQLRGHVTRACDVAMAQGAHLPPSPQSSAPDLPHAATHEMTRQSCHCRHHAGKSREKRATPSQTLVVIYTRFQNNSFILIPCAITIYVLFMLMCCPGLSAAGSGAGTIPAHERL